MKSMKPCQNGKRGSNGEYQDYELLAAAKKRTLSYRLFFAP